MTNSASVWGLPFLGSPLLRLKASILLVMLSLGACYKNRTLDIDPRLEEKFELSLNNLSEAKKCFSRSKIIIKNGMFRGRFVVGDEHFPDFIAIPRKGNYISIPSNELIHEYYGSKNGTGGVRYFDASSNPERIYIRGYAITGDLVCGGRSISAQGMSGIFLLIDYGQKVKNSKLEKGEK